MTPAQAFDILKAASNPHDAKIVLNAIGTNDFNIAAAADKLRRGVPVAKIIGRKWFYGLEFETNGYTLDPRPDSETIVQSVIEQFRDKGQEQGTGIRILDLGTGTGNLICSIVKNMPGATGVGIDISRGAVRVARRNVERLGLGDRIKIVHADFYQCAKCKVQSANFDIIISNPPYIPIGDQRVNDAARHDPACALYAGIDGLDAYRALANVIANKVKQSMHNHQQTRTSNGLPRDFVARNDSLKFFVEIGAGQFTAVRKIFTDNGWRFVKYYKDLGGKIRVLEFNSDVV